MHQENPVSMYEWNQNVALHSATGIRDQKNFSSEMVCLFHKELRILGLKNFWLSQTDIFISTVLKFLISSVVMNNKIKVTILNK